MSVGLIRRQVPSSPSATAQETRIIGFSYVHPIAPVGIISGVSWSAPAAVLGSGDVLKWYLLARPMLPQAFIIGALQSLIQSNMSVG